MPRMSGNPIIVKFVSMIERDVVLRHAYRLQPRSGVGVSEHLPVALQKQKQLLRDAYKHAKAKGAKPKFRLQGVTMTLYVAGQSYTTPDDYFKRNTAETRGMYFRISVDSRPHRGELRASYARAGNELCDVKNRRRLVADVKNTFRVSASFGRLQKIAGDPENSRDARRNIGRTTAVNVV
ncbi:hypothetical protein Bbelb_331530 [Branchiostoma belcheri]|nr:hypothetical protein Bbelb_331530 [Branchiostoma belcheri]